MSLKNELDDLLKSIPPRVFLEKDGYTTYHKGWTTRVEWYIQHIPEIVDEVQSKFLIICDRELGTNFSNGEEIHRQGIVGRYIDDSNNRDLSMAWNRFICIDSKYREWSQPYFAINSNNLFDTDFDENINDGLPYKGDCLNKVVPELIEWFRDNKLNIILDI